MDRYISAEMNEIWSERNKYTQWLKIELAIVGLLELKGKAKEGTTKKLKERLWVDVPRIQEIERETQHDVVAFTRSLGEQAKDPEFSRWIHYGVTSSDIVDTANSLLLVQAGERISEALLHLKHTLRVLAKVHAGTPMIGRTHGIHADTITLGYKFAGWYENVLRDQMRLDKTLWDLRVGMTSGAVGTYRILSREDEGTILNMLGLRQLRHTTQVIPRDLYAELITTLGIMATNIERYATEIRHLQRTEVGELAEEFSSKQKGSSAMPHKRNPIGSENIAGIARMIRGYIHPALENIVLWHERDISHSSVERMMLPQITGLAEYQICKFTEILKNLSVNTDRMAENLRASNGATLSQEVMHRLIDEGMSREEAYDLIQPMALNAMAGGENFINQLRQNRKVSNALDIDKFVYEQARVADMEELVRNIIV